MAKLRSQRRFAPPRPSSWGLRSRTYGSFLSLVSTGSARGRERLIRWACQGDDSEHGGRQVGLAPRCHAAGRPKLTPGVAAISNGSGDGASRRVTGRRCAITGRRWPLSRRRPSRSISLITTWAFSREAPGLGAACCRSWSPERPTSLSTPPSAQAPVGRMHSRAATANERSGQNIVCGTFRGASQSLRETGW